jgi:hypothetical protein
MVETLRTLRVRDVDTLSLAIGSVGHLFSKFPKTAKSFVSNKTFRVSRRASNSRNLVCAINVLSRISTQTQTAQTVVHS